MPDQPINSINDTRDRTVAGCLQTPVAIVAACLINSFFYNIRQHTWSISSYYEGVYYTLCTQYTFTHILMKKLPRVLDLRNRRSCNIVVPNRRPRFPIFLVPGALNGANTVTMSNQFSLVFFCFVLFCFFAVWYVNHMCFIKEFLR